MTGNGAAACGRVRAEWPIAQKTRQIAPSRTSRIAASHCRGRGLGPKVRWIQSLSENRIAARSASKGNTTAAALAALRAGIRPSETGFPRKPSLAEGAAARTGNCCIDLGADCVVEFSQSNPLAPHQPRARFHSADSALGLPSGGDDKLRPRGAGRRCGDLPPAGSHRERAAALADPRCDARDGDDPQQFAADCRRERKAAWRVGGHGGGNRRSAAGRGATTASTPSTGRTAAARACTA